MDEVDASSRGGKGVVMLPAHTMSTGIASEVENLVIPEEHDAAF